MGHYIGIVPAKDGREIKSILKPFDETIEVAPYVEKSGCSLVKETREQLYELLEKSNLNAEYRVEAERKLSMSDTELHDLIVEEYDYRTDAQGNVISTYNPQSKYDYWRLATNFAWDESGLLAQGMSVADFLEYLRNRSDDSFLPDIAYRNGRGESVWECRNLTFPKQVSPSVWKTRLERVLRTDGHHDGRVWFIDYHI